jgi:hypothetical protein
MANELKVKDGLGTIQTLSAISASDGISTYHALTGTIASDISSSLSSIKTNISNLLSGTVISASVDIITGDTNLITGSIKELSSSLNYSGSVAQNVYNYTSQATLANIVTASHSELTSGSPFSVSYSANRKSLIFFNHTNADVYMSIAASLDVPNGYYTYVLASSGSYISETRYSTLLHYLTGSSGVTNGRVTITSIT